MENEKIIELAKSLDVKLTKGREGCPEGETLISINVPVEDVEKIIDYLLETAQVKTPCTSAEENATPCTLAQEAKITAFDHTIEMMRSSDYKERFRAEYEQTKIRYEKLKKFNTKIEASEIAASYKAGVVAPEHDCPVYLLREHQRKMGEYLHLLEVRAEIEHIEL